MARAKVLAHRVMTAAAWLGIGTLTLLAAYSAGEAATSVVSLIPWR